MVLEAFCHPLSHLVTWLPSQISLKTSPKWLVVQLCKFHIAPEHMPYSQKTSFPTLILIVFFYVFFWGCNSDNCFVWMKFFRCCLFIPSGNPYQAAPPPWQFLLNWQLEKKHFFPIGVQYHNNRCLECGSSGSRQVDFWRFFLSRLILDWQFAKDPKKSGLKNKE